LKTEIIINAATHETRIAILEDSKLVEIWVERPENERMIGDIYKGKVSAVIPGIQAAFVDIGMEKSAFLHVSDVSDTSIDFAAQYELDDDEDEHDSDSPVSTIDQSKKKRSVIFKGSDKKHSPIETVLSKEQEILVQVTKEPISTKGARLTSQITLAGRFFVLVPGSRKVGVSRRIASWNERKRLRKLALKYQPKGFGLIIRTLAEGKNEDDVKAEITDLINTYESLLKKAESLPTPSLIHKEMGMTSGIIRDLLGEDVERVMVDSREHYDDIRNYLKNTLPTLIKKVTLYKDKEPIFDNFGIEKEIDAILSRKLWLKTGAFLVLDPTEALTVIDVNSGSNIGKSNQEETIVNINIESAIEIARQLRLRDIGGIIVIDFIDMQKSENRKKVEDVFVNALKNDRSRISISQISEFGLMEMTRQRVRPSLIFTFAESCPTCGGVGMVQGRDTTVTKIERWFARAEAFGKEKSYTVFVHPAVFEFLIENNEERLTMLRSSTLLNIEIVVDAKISIKEFYCFSTKRFADVTNDFNPGKKPSTSAPIEDSLLGSPPQHNNNTPENDPTWAKNETSTPSGTASKFGRKPKSKKRR